ncbi:fibrinogen-like YCDxxxxGGGW domain-containing protein, partial [Aeromicrobium sp. Leaf272]
MTWTTAARRLVALVIVPVAVTTSAHLGTAPAAQAATVVPDGSTQASAAASCWEVKQVEPSATDGVYWLLTPQLRTPTQ